jgi:hypothetical protein
MTRTGTAHTEGANIVYDYVSEGPLLLTFAGGGGIASCFSEEQGGKAMPVDPFLEPFLVAPSKSRR